MEEITINQDVRHGKPTIAGTRITVDEVLGMLESGMTYEDIQKEYDITKEQILAVIKYTASFLKGEHIQELKRL